MSPEQELAELRRRAGELERMKLTREAQADQAEAHRRTAEERLQKEFGCTPGEAEQLLTTKRRELDELIQQIREALS